MAVIKVSSFYGTTYAKPFEFVDCTKIEEVEKPEDLLPDFDIVEDDKE